LEIRKIKNEENNKIKKLENQNIINKININNINYQITQDSVLFREEEGYLYIYDDDKIDFGTESEKEKWKLFKKRKLEENSRFKINEKEYKM
jgi:hypothetical protein